MAIGNIIGKAVAKKVGKKTTGAAEDIAYKSVKKTADSTPPRTSSMRGAAPDVEDIKYKGVKKPAAAAEDTSPRSSRELAVFTPSKELTVYSAEQAKRGGMGKAAVAGGAAAAAVGAAALSGRGGKEEKPKETEAPTRSAAPTRMSSGKVQMEEEAPTRSAAKAEEKASPSKAKAAEQTSRVVSKKELEDSGLSLRDFLNKERGLTRREDKGETASKQAEKPTGVREGRNESIDEETRKRAMESAGYAKGGMVRNQGIGASMKPHNLFGKKK